MVILPLGLKFPGFSQCFSLMVPLLSSVLSFSESHSGWEQFNFLISRRRPASMSLKGQWGILAQIPPSEECQDFLEGNREDPAGEMTPEKQSGGLHPRRRLSAAAVPRGGRQGLPPPSQASSCSDIGHQSRWTALRDDRAVRKHRLLLRGQRTEEGRGRSPKDLGKQGGLLGWAGLGFILRQEEGRMLIGWRRWSTEGNTDIFSGRGLGGCLTA